MDREHRIQVTFKYNGTEEIIKSKPSKICGRVETLLYTDSLHDEKNVLGVFTLSCKMRPCTEHYILQRWIKKWKIFVNVDSVDQIKHMDTLRVRKVQVGECDSDEASDGVDDEEVSTSTSVAFQVKEWWCKISNYSANAS